MSVAGALKATGTLPRLDFFVIAVSLQMVSRDGMLTLGGLCGVVFWQKKEKNKTKIK